MPFLSLGVYQDSGSSRTSRQDAGERCLGTGGPLGSGILQLAVSCIEGDREGEKGVFDHPMINLLCMNGYVTVTKIKMHTVLSVLGLIRKGHFMASVDIKDA